MSPTELAEVLRRRLEAEPDIVSAYLFGSSARGEAGPSSDVDLAVLFERTPPHELLARPFALASELAGLVGRDVDCVVLNDAPLDLVHRVLRDGILVLDRDRSRRIAFEVRARAAYLDLLPVLRAYRQPRSSSHST